MTFVMPSSYFAAISWEAREDSDAYAEIISPVPLATLFNMARKPPIGLRVGTDNGDYVATPFELPVSSKSEMETMQRHARNGTHNKSKDEPHLLAMFVNEGRDRVEAMQDLLALSTDPVIGYRFLHFWWGCGEDPVSEFLRFRHMAPMPDGTFVCDSDEGTPTVLSFNREAQRIEIENPFHAQVALPKLSFPINSVAVTHRP